jgi:hypothetical protein
MLQGFKKGAKPRLMRFDDAILLVFGALLD